MDTTATSPAPTHDDAEQRQRLAQSLQHMVDETEQLLRSARNSGSEQLEALRDKLELQLQKLRSELLALRENTAHHMRRAAHAADTTAHQHPYAAMGLAAGAGLLIGMLITRR
jgi:ElaB/YqjD/DUF883 family membrane-anchored ribosome-binding protein